MRNLVVVVLAISLSCLAAGAQSPSSLIISNITLVDVAAGRVDAGMSVMVEGDRTVWVGKTAGARAPAGARVVDGRGQFLPSACCSSLNRRRP